MALMGEEASIEAEVDTGPDAAVPAVAATVSATAPAPRPAVFPGMVWIPGGTFQMGSNHHYPEEGPAHAVAVDGFWMDQHTVTNADFRRFVDETGYMTIAERPLLPEDYPGVRPGAPGAGLGGLPQAARAGRPDATA